MKTSSSWIGADMTVLSDSEIRALVADGKLVAGGDLSRISTCAYEFRPGAVLRTGPVDDDRRLARDWTAGLSEPTDSYDIPPGELVWIRTRENVAMPEDVCAFWWQTNTLSKQGLMLVNMSMVEPGYQGPLACLFMNFGRHAVEIGPDSIVAKLVFMRTQNVDSPLDLAMQRDEYDRRLVSSAKGAPATFLDIGRFSQDNVVDQIREETDDATRKAQKTLAEDLETARETLQTLRTELKTELEADSRTQIAKVLGGAFVGFVLVVAAMTFVPWLQSTVKPNLSDDINGEVNRVLTERLSGSSQVNDSEALQRRVQELEKQIRELQSPRRGGQLSP